MNRLKAEKKKLDALIDKHKDLQHPFVQKQSQKVDKLVVEHMGGARKKYRIKGTDMEGYIVQRGARGLVRLEIIKNFNPFMRTVFDMCELEEIEC